MASNKAFERREQGIGEASVYDLNRAKYESHLAAAHRAINRARQEADRMAADNASEQLKMCERVLIGLTEASLKGRDAKRIPGQLEVPDPVLTPKA